MRTSTLWLVGLTSLYGCVPETPDDVVKDTGTLEEEEVLCDEDGDGYCPSDGDCDDADADVNPGVSEICDGLDNDCDGSVDEDGTTAYYHDADGDGFGDPQTEMIGCEPEAGYVANAEDCDDTNEYVYPDAEELCDGLDNDCNGVIDDDLATTWYPDADADGYGDDSAAEPFCADPGEGWLSTGGDCNDAEPLAWTGADEVCDGVDNDCDGGVDNDAIDAIEGAADSDGDGFGDPVGTAWSCEPPSNTLDCDDADPAEPQAVDGMSASGSPDGTLANPWPSIQEGMDAANNCVAVFPYTYVENINFNGEDLSVFSTEGYETTTIDGDGNGSVVTFAGGEGPAAELIGFTITNGSGTMEENVVTEECGCATYCSVTYRRYYGGGLFIDGSAPTLTSLNIIGNDLPPRSATQVSETEAEYVYSYGGGVFIANTTRGGTLQLLWDVGASGTLWDAANVVAENWADQGGGVYVGGDTDVDFRHGHVYFNGASSGGGFAIVSGKLAATNAIFADNTAEEGGAIWADAASATFWNLTVVGNDTSGTGAGFSITGGAGVSISATAVTHNAGAGTYVDDGSTANIEFGDYYDNTSDFAGTAAAGTGVIYEDPQYTAWSDNSNYADDDLTLVGGSLLIDAGHPSAAYNDPDGTPNDIGAFGGPDADW